jgi:hypothetical protein
VTVHGSEHLLLPNKRPVSKPWEKGRVSERITAISRFNLISFGRTRELKGSYEAKNDVCNTVKGQKLFYVVLVSA